MLLSKALSKTHASQIFLDIFAGEGNVGKQITHMTHCPVLSADIKNDPVLDLTDEIIIAVIIFTIVSIRLLYIIDFSQIGELLV